MKYRRAVKAHCMAICNRLRSIGNLPLETLEIAQYLTGEE